MMGRSSLFGRRVHIAGAIADDASIATAAEVESARDLVTMLVKRLIKCGANFVIPVDAEPHRKSDDLPICFDWLIWQALKENWHLRPGDAPGPLAIAVQHHKSENQIPREYERLWDELRVSPQVSVQNAAHWDMASKRMEIQAKAGDVLITLGGAEGVLFLSNLYHDAGKPVIPLDLPLCSDSTGSRHLFKFGLQANNAQRLFQLSDGKSSHAELNQVAMPKRQATPDRVDSLLELLESLERPTAFAIRMLNKSLPENAAVSDFFDNVVKPVVEGELGYKLVVVDGEQPFSKARMDQEIFERLHRSSVVLADITGARPNCFIELGYAYGRALPVAVMGMDGSDLPFDIASISGHLWKTESPTEDRRREFRTHWNAIRNRPPIVPYEPLVP